MKVAIVGYGRMGKAIRNVLSDSGDEIVAIIDTYSDDLLVTSSFLDSASVVGSDVVIDFSSPPSAVDNMIMYSQLGIPAVIGTTGWYDELDRVKVLCSGEDTKIIYSGNYSLGVAVFLKLVKRAGELFNRISGYDVGIREVHHTGKADSPSGTALMIANQLISTLDNKTELLIGNSNGKIKEEQLQIVSERVGKEPGLHQVTFDSLADTLTLEHHARSRTGFATGAVAVARWLISTDKHGILTLDDFLGDLLGEL